MDSTRGSVGGGASKAGDRTTVEHVAEEILRRMSAYLPGFKLWRVRTMISSAYHMGAFESYGFEMCQGVGFRRIRPALAVARKAA